MQTSPSLNSILYIDSPSPVSSIDLFIRVHCTVCTFEGDTSFCKMNASCESVVPASSTTTGSKQFRTSGSGSGSGSCRRPVAACLIPGPVQKSRRPAEVAESLLIPDPIQKTLETAGLALMQQIGEANIVRPMLQNLRELMRVQIPSRILDAHNAIMASRVLAQDVKGAVWQMRHGKARIQEIVGYMEYFSQDEKILTKALSVFLQLAVTDDSGWDNELKIAFVNCNGIRALVNAMPVYRDGRSYFVILKSLEIVDDTDWNAKVEDLILRAGGFGEIVQPMNLDDIEEMAIGVDLLKSLVEWARPNRITTERIEVHGKLQRHLPTLESFVRRGRDYERRVLAEQRVLEIHQGLADLDAMYDGMIDTLME